MDKGRMYGTYEPPTPTNASAVVVPIKSAWLSKINWTQIAGPVAGVLAFIGIKDVSVDQIAAIMLGIQSLQSVATIVIKTFYTGTVTPSSAAGIPPGGG